MSMKRDHLCESTWHRSALHKRCMNLIKAMDASVHLHMQTAACGMRMRFDLPPAGTGGCWDVQGWLWQFSAKRKPVFPFPALSPWANHAELNSSQESAWKGKTICSGALESDTQHAGLVGFFSFNQHQWIIFWEMLMNLEYLQVAPARHPCSPPGPCPFLPALQKAAWHWGARTAVLDPVVSLHLHASARDSWGQQQFRFPFQTW